MNCPRPSRIAFFTYLCMLMVATRCTAQPLGRETATSRQHFGLAGREGGAAGFLRTLQTHMSDGALERLASVLPDAGGGGDAALSALAALLDADGDLGIDTAAEALVYRCRGALESEDPGLHGHGHHEGRSHDHDHSLSATGAWPPAAADPPGGMAWSLASRPGSTRKIHLQFRGANVTGSSWNFGFGSSIVVPPYDADGDATSFSAAELSDIVSIWRTVAEHFAPFDVDVTTVPPSGASLAPNMSQTVVIGGSGTWYSSMPPGGVSFVDRFGAAAFQPSFVFPANLGPFNPKYVAHATTHEIGHALGLLHDGVVNGSAYYTGGSSPDAVWAPLMGQPYFKPLVQFDRGEYDRANNQQDDYAVMARWLPLLPQASGPGLALAPLLPLAAPPAPGLAAASGAGLVSRGPGEPELWAFDVGGAGNATLVLSVVPQSSRGIGRSVLDAVLVLRDSSGAPLALLNPAGVDSGNGLGIAAVTVALPAAGRYTVAVSGASGGGPLSSGGYSAYGSRGSYQLSISGYPAPGGTPSPQPSPSPSPPPTPPAPQPSPSPPPLARIAMVVSRVELLRQCTVPRVACICGARVFVTSLSTGAPVNNSVVVGTFSSQPALWPPVARRGSTRTKGFVRFNAVNVTAPAPASVCAFTVTRVVAVGHTLDAHRSLLTGSVAMPAF